VSCSPWLLRDGCRVGWYGALTILAVAVKMFVVEMFVVSRVWWFVRGLAVVVGVRYPIRCVVRMLIHSVRPETY
jgi:hypothetical protein